MDNNVEIQKAGLWSRAKISTLSIILLVMMAGAGVFFTTAFSVLHIQLDGALNDWHTIQKILSDTGALQTSNLQAHSDQLSHSIEAVKSMTIYFIIAVLVAVGAFFILMLVNF